MSSVVLQIRRKSPVVLPVRQNRPCISDKNEGWGGAKLAGERLNERERALLEKPDMEQEWVAVQDSVTANCEGMIRLGHSPIKSSSVMLKLTKRLLQVERLCRFFGLGKTVI
jgi:hypothetical protein